MKRSIVYAFLVALGLAVSMHAIVTAQQAGTNVNVLPSYPIGPTVPPFFPLQPLPGLSSAELQADSLKGDIYLQREVEPVVAASTYNPDHLVAAFGDFRTVDIGTDTGVPGNAAEGWIGYSRSYDRGKHWYGAMVPGFPQGTSSADLNSPLYGLNAGSDAVLTTTPGGHFYLGGLFFTRGGLSNVAVMHMRDVPSLDGGDSIQPGKITIIDKGSNSDTGNFEDKPSIAGDIPRGTSDPSACGPVYMAYTIFTGGTGTSFTSKVGFSRSKQGKCGEAWDNDQYLNKNYKQNQGTAMAVDPATGKIVVIWRHFFTAGGDGFPDSILMATSTDFGSSFSAPVAITGTDFTPFDQVSISTANCAADLSTCPVTFRSNAFPAISIDGDGNIYVAIQEKVFGSGGYYEPRITIRTLKKNATKWATKSIIEIGPATGGQQVMPSLTFGAGLLRAMWYDFRSAPAPSNNLPVGSTGWYIAGVDRRMETRVAQSSLSPDANGNPAFASSAPVTSYLLDSSTKHVPNVPGSSLPAVNRPNLPMYVTGTTGFTGDYITIMANSPFVATPGAANPFRWATQQGDYPALSSLAVWTDSRDVVFPGNGLFDKQAWQNYAPPGLGGASCVNPGSRDQNVYFAEVKPGVIAGSPATSRQLVNGNGQPFERAFPFYVQNPNPLKKFFRLTFQSDSATRPVVGSFLQGPFVPEPQATKSPIATVDVAILGYSTVSKTLYSYCAGCTAANSFAPFSMNVQEVSGIGGSLVNGGLTTVLRFNNDSTAPFVTNTNLPTQEIHTVLVSNPQFTDPQFTDPQFTDPQFTDPQFTDPQFTDPQFTDPQFTDSQPVGDFVWTANNVGNNASAYSAGVNVSQAFINSHPNFKYKLIITRAYNKPGSSNCYSQPIPTDQIISIIPLNPQFTDPQFTDPQFTDPQFTDPQFTDPQFTDAAFTAVPPPPGGSGAAAVNTAATTSATTTSSVSSGTAPILPDQVFIVLRVYGPKGVTTQIDPTEVFREVSTVVTPQAGDSVSNNGTITVTPPTPSSTKGFTTTTLTRTPATSVFGQPVTFTAHVVLKGTPTPVTTGTVEFREVNASGVETRSLAVVGVDASGNAVATVSDFTVSASAHLVNAIFSGTSTLNGSFSTTVTETVSSAPTTTTLTSSPNPSTLGDLVTFTATVSAGPVSTAIPQGSVTFGTLGSAAVDGTGKATLTTAALAVGSYSVTATFTDAGNFGSSTSNTVVQTVNGITPAVTLTSTPNPATTVQQITATVTVDPPSAAGGVPAGTVKLYNVTTPATPVLIGSAAVNPVVGQKFGVATITFGPLPAGTYSLSATYEPNNANFVTQTSATLTQVVSAAAGLLFVATDQEEFDNDNPANNEPSRLAIANVTGPNVTSTTVTTLTFPLNGLADGGGFLYGGDPGEHDVNSSQLRKFDYSGGLISQTAISGGTVGCCHEDYAFNGTTMYRAQYASGGGKIEQIDPSTGAVTNTFTLPPTATEAIGITFVGSDVWISRWSAQEVGVWSPATNTYTRKFGLSSLGGGMAYDASNGVLWVGRSGGCVEPYDLNGNVLGTSDGPCNGAGFQPFGPINDTIDGLEFVSNKPFGFGSLQIGSTNFPLGATEVPISGTVVNQTAVDQQGVVLQSFITQGTISVGAGGTLLLTNPLGFVAASSVVVLSPTNYGANAGQPGLAAGPAVLTIQLLQGNTVVDSRTFAITLVSTIGE
jgi:hypothetical protein